MGFDVSDREDVRVGRRVALREKPDDVAPLLDRYAKVIQGNESGRETWKQRKVLNQLGVIRGTLNLL